MGEVTIREAGPENVHALHRALVALSHDLGDNHLATEDVLSAACFGRTGFAAAVLAEADRAVVGAALVSPVFSTTRGAPGAYLSDLWVAPLHRRTGLGRRLIAEVARHSEGRWGARFVKLAVYADNTGATAFYRRLGFAFREREANAILEGAELSALVGEKT